ncbi:MAG TPA: histidinol-phosphatase HisJ family protein [Solirubrobacteraceae bacterium]|jgi:histidinol-phosphatase (PHP family)|nr:histidinol-phosphatase HisJ family protein [Solirubrobacteraceae bacterium]
MSPNHFFEMLTDYHLHLRLDDLDATVADHFTAENVERYREAASARGIAELGVSEHVYRFRQALEVWQHPLWRECAHDDLEEYCRFVREETDLRLGIEADFIPGAEDRIANLLEVGDFDYVVGSVHFLRNHSLDTDDHSVWDWDPIHPRSAEEIWREYFLVLGEAARSGLFDILAHPDLVKVWGRERPVPEGDLRRYYELAMDGIAESGIAIEVSTAGLRKRAREIYPAPAFLSMCLEAGAPVALSSDAHRPEDVGADYDQALELLESVGVRELCVFERRTRRLERINPVGGTSPHDGPASGAGVA